ncbi:9315_t:CDS:2 [Paraglomus occultum]|uniref:9315_t:CDS:1 n=1 Tax=Paraglomus occultum TaxID=144539 RepID=A0A9N8WUR0_9GLOM|nr:9315_t:CDS:2 [Paraglomus occultum]
MLLDMHSADLHNDYYLSKLKVLDFSDDCCELSMIPDLYLSLRILKSGDELIIVIMRRWFNHYSTQRFGNEHYTSNYVLRGSYFMSMQGSSPLSNFKFGLYTAPETGSLSPLSVHSTVFFAMATIKNLARTIQRHGSAIRLANAPSPPFKASTSPRILSVKQDSQKPIFFQWRTLEDFLDSAFDLLQQDYLANPVPERGIIIKRRRRDTMVGAKEEDK